MKKLILLLIILLFLLPGICLSSQNETKSAASPVLKVMTLNLAHGRKDGFNQILLSQSKIKSNLADIAKVLKHQDVDIVALQEADAPSWWSGDFNHVAWLAEQADYLTYIQSSHADSWFFSYGTGLLSHRAFTDSIKHTFQPSPPTLNKGFTLGQVSWQFSSDAEPLLLDIISVHLDFSRQSVREQQTAEIKKVLAERHHPMIIMGDFNSDWFAEEKVIRELTKKGDYHVYRPEAQDLGTYKSSHRLDWIILSRELEFKSLTILPEILSDHSAVMAEISIKKQNKSNTKK